MRGDIAGRAAPAVDPSPTHTEPGGHGLGGQTAATHRSAQAVGAARPGQAAGGEADSEEGYSAGHPEAADATDVRINLNFFQKKIFCP